jgi:hypothetical protein
MGLQPQGESVRRAVKFISEEKQAYPETSLGLLIQKACMKFDLTPKDAAFLGQFYKESGGNTEGEGGCEQD